MLANVNLATDLEVVAEHGRIIVIGSRGKIELDPRLLMRNESLCTGVFLMKATEEEWREMGAEILRGVEGNWINPIVAQELPLSAAAEVTKVVQYLSLLNVPLKRNSNEKKVHQPFRALLFSSTGCIFPTNFQP